MTEPKTLCSILGEVGESSSLHGIPNIISAKHVSVKILWTLILTGTFSLLIYQTVGLFDSYFSYNTRISITRQMGPLPLPSVTICNRNPVKRSKLSTLSNSQLDQINTLAEYMLTTLDLNKVTDMISTSNVTTNILLNTSNLVTGNFSDINISSIILRLSLFKRDASGYEILSISALKAAFFEELKTLPDLQKQSIGHQFDDMVVGGSFNGNALPFKVHKQVYSNQFGNCFTIDTRNMSYVTEAAHNSIDLLLNVETSEYLTSFIPTYAIQLMIHEQGSLPPLSTSISVGTNFETLIKVKRSSINRLGGGFRGCSDGQMFRIKYGIAYSSALCLSLCETDLILRKCDCLSDNIIDTVVSNVSFCDYRNTNTRLCSLGIRESIQKGISTCNCKPPCKQEVFSSTVSGRLWPNDFYIRNVLLSKSCRLNLSISSDLCFGSDVSLTPKQLSVLARNFASVRIQFDDLMYDVITEEPSYDTFRFISDIGGAMGFFMGAYILSFLEPLQVALEVILYCRSKKIRVENAEETSF